MPGVTRCTILLQLPTGTAFVDPDPEQTTRRGVDLVAAWDDSVAGVVGWVEGGLSAARTAAAHPGLARLVIVATPFPEAPPDDLDLDAVAAKTLLLFGSADPAAGSRHGRAWQKRLPNARLEMVPGGGRDLLVPMWGRVLSHLAPKARVGSPR